MLLMRPSVSINVEELLEAKNKPPSPLAVEDVTMLEPVVAPAPTETAAKPKSPPKRKAEPGAPFQNKKPKLHIPTEAVILKIPAVEIFDLPCCLCVSNLQEGLLPVHDPPASNVAVGTRAGRGGWMAHEQCAKIVPETWVDEDANGRRFVFGVDGIVKDRWNLVSFRNALSLNVSLILRSQKCFTCVKVRARAHGAPIQCTKGKCPKAFHVSCAQDDHQVNFSIVEEVEKQVIVVDNETTSPKIPHASVPPAADGPTIAAPMDVDSATQQPTPSADSVSTPSAVPAPPAEDEKFDARVIKSIWKSSYELLCPQHNPVSRSLFALSSY